MEQAKPSPWKHWAMIVVGFLFIGGEGLVQAGVPLPGAGTVIPEWASGLLGVILMAGGAYFRSKLQSLLADKSDAA